MTISENQLKMVRLMICNPRVRIDENTLAEWAGMSDEDIASVVELWKSSKVSNPNTPQGLIDKINSLEE